MSIEFKNCRWGKGRHSRLFKKTKRAAMNGIDAPHLPMRVQTGKSGYYGQTANYPIHVPYKKVWKFLMARVGKPVDKVFSEFLIEAKKFHHVENLKEVFYSYIDYKYWKLRAGEAEGFYISNGILNYKDDFKVKTEPVPKKFIEYNDKHWNTEVFMDISLGKIEGPIPIGKFWIEIKGQYMFLPVYAVHENKWKYSESNIRKYQYLKEFTPVRVIDKGTDYVYKPFLSYYADYKGVSYVPYIVRISDIENYKKESFKE